MSLLPNCEAQLLGRVSICPVRVLSASCGGWGILFRLWLHGHSAALQRELCEFIVEKKRDVPIIYTGGYYMRTLAAGYEILGVRRSG